MWEMILARPGWGFYDMDKGGFLQASRRLMARFFVNFLTPPTCPQVYVGFVLT